MVQSIDRWFWIAEAGVDEHDALMCVDGERLNRNCLSAVRMTFRRRDGAQIEDDDASDFFSASHCVLSRLRFNHLLLRIGIVPMINAALNIDESLAHIKRRLRSFVVAGRWLLSGLEKLELS